MSEPPQYPSYPGDPNQGQQSPSPAGWGEQPQSGYGEAPPPGWGQQPPAYAHLASGHPVPEYAGWGSRAGAYLLDVLFAALVAAPFAIGGVVILGVTSTETVDAYGYTTYESDNPVGFILIGLAYLAYLGFLVWTFGIRQGRLGQSYGKKIVGIAVVKELTGLPAGAGAGFGRMLMNGLLSSLTCYINLLWPLWDAKHQALHDKVLGTVVVKASPRV